MNTEQAINALAEFGSVADEDTFMMVFGNVIGSHLWGNYWIYEGNIIRLWQTLDNTNRHKLLSHLEIINLRL